MLASYRLWDSFSQAIKVLSEMADGSWAIIYMLALKVSSSLRKGNKSGLVKLLGFLQILPLIADIALAGVS